VKLYLSFGEERKTILQCKKIGVTLCSTMPKNKLATGRLTMASKRVSALIAAFAAVALQNGCVLAADAEGATSGIPPGHSQYRPYPQLGQTADERDTLHYLWNQAQAFAHLRGHDHEHGYLAHPVYKVTAAELAHEMCRTDLEECDGVAAIHDPQSGIIYVRDTLQPLRLTLDSSVLVHEFVHALQHERESELEMYGSCEDLLRTERAAYRAQNAFLDAHGLYGRQGMMLYTQGSSVCPEHLPSQRRTVTAATVN
jgi:hypothetical protein